MSPHMPGAIPWLEDVEPDPIDGEILTITAGAVWWSAPTADDE